jgi:tetratricopeptide (TPR) repeat protein
VARNQGDFGAARPLHEESLAIHRELEDKTGIAGSLNDLGSVAREQGEYEAARVLFEESLAIFRGLGDKTSIATSLADLAHVAQAQGDPEKARALLEEALQLARGVDDKNGLIHLLGGIGHAARHLGDYGRAKAVYQESLALRYEARNTCLIAASLEDFAGLAGRQQQWERAARLLGATEAMCADLGATLPIAIPDEYWRTISGARTALGEAAFTAAWAAGRAMSLEAAMCVALEESEIPTTGRQGSSGDLGVTEQARPQKQQPGMRSS